MRKDIFFFFGGAVLTAAAVKYADQSWFWDTTIYVGVLVMALSVLDFAVRTTASHQKAKPLSLIGIAVCFIGLIAFIYVYFRSPAPEVSEQSVLPIVVSALANPGYARFSGLSPDFDSPNIDARESDPPWIWIGDVFISNISKDRAVSLRIFLIATDEKGQVNRLEADGKGPLGNFMGRSDFATKLYQRNGIEPGSSFILSPLTLKAQETVHGTLPFIIHPFGFTKEINNKILEYWIGHFIPPVERNPPFKFRLEIQDVISGVKVEVPVPGDGYSGKG
jgi:hypothetical protein